MSNEQKLGDILDAVWTEVETAQSKFAPMNSYHEGYAILKEEVDELWDEVKKKQLVSATLALKPGESMKLDSSKYQNSAKIRAEAIQIAAMAVRLILDCCEKRER